jgi:Ca2+-binding RTX toxin-like protein
VILGSSLTDITNLKGGAGNDYLKGNQNSNTIHGGPGADWMGGGGAGVDTVDYSDQTSAVYAAIDDVAHSGVANGAMVKTIESSYPYLGGDCQLGATDAGGGGSSENDTIHNDISNIVGGTGDDCLKGQKADPICNTTVFCQNNLTGGAGNDMLFGYDDNDILEGAGEANPPNNESNYIDCGSGTFNISHDYMNGYKASNCQF